MSLKPLKNKNLAEVIRNFTPNWFTLNMGTGIAFLTLHNINANIFYGQTQFGIGLWIIDIFFFLLFSFYSQSNFLSRNN